MSQKGAFLRMTERSAAQAADVLVLLADDPDVGWELADDWNEVQDHPNEEMHASQVQSFLRFVADALRARGGKVPL